MKGGSFEEALAKSINDPALGRAKTFSGDRPSSTIFLDRLDPATLGALIAFYEHRTFANAVLMEINPFDQWGVELGKEIARSVEAVLDGEEDGSLDPSTRMLVAQIGRASCRERVCQYVLISVVAGSVKKKNQTQVRHN